MVSVQILALSVALAGGGETVLLDFQAPWCAPCRSMEGTVTELERAGYPVRKVNVDRERDLAARYSVNSIPCFVLLVDGQEAGRLTGVARRDALVELFASARVARQAPRAIARGQSPDPPAQAAGISAQPDRNPFVPARFSPGVVETQHNPAPGPAAAVQSAQDLIESSVRLTIEDPKGKSYGSGTIIDARQGEALVLTCGHIFRDSGGKGQITVDLFGAAAGQKLPGRLVTYDLKSDVGLISIQPGANVRVSQVADKGHRIAKGDRVTTVGCNNGGPATALETKVTGVDKFLGPPNVQVAGLPVQGRSGGGLFSADGRVIGVCNAADPADNEGLYAALATIHDQLDKAGLSEIYARRADRGAGAVATAATMPGPVDDPRAASGSMNRGSAVRGMDGVAALSSLTESQRAALAEVQKRGDGAEVICIVRPLADPRAKSEVIMLDRASSAFLRQLAADRQAQETRHTTSLRKRQ